MRPSRRHWIFGTAIVALIAAASYVGLELSGNPEPGEPARQETATGKPGGYGGEPAPGTPTALPRDVAPGPTPSGTATPGRTPAWRTAPDGTAAPAGGNETPATGTTGAAGGPPR